MKGSGSLTRDSEDGGCDAQQENYFPQHFLLNFGCWNQLATAVILNAFFFFLIRFVGSCRRILLSASCVWLNSKTESHPLLYCRQLKSTACWTQQQHAAIRLGNFPASKKSITTTNSPRGKKREEGGYMKWRDILLIDMCIQAQYTQSTNIRCAKAQHVLTSSFSFGFFFTYVWYHL